MGLAPSDPKPSKITIHDAYTKVRDWYRMNTSCFIEQEPPKNSVTIVRDFRHHAKASLELVESLPVKEALSELEIRAVLAEIIAGKLEWAYHQSDGSYKMAAYAHAALEQAGFPTFLSKEEKRNLKNSCLYEYLSPHLRD